MVARKCGKATEEQCYTGKVTEEPDDAVKFQAMQGRRPEAEKAVHEKWKTLTIWR